MIKSHEVVDVTKQAKPFNILGKVGTSTGTLGRIYDGLSGNFLVQTSPDTLDVSNSASTGHFSTLTLSGNGAAKRVNVFNAAGEPLGSFPSERTTGKVLIQTTKNANDVLQWDSTGFSVSFFNRTVLSTAATAGSPKTALAWQVPFGEKLITVAINDEGSVVYAATCTDEDPDLAIVYRFVIAQPTLYDVVMTLSTISYFSAATTATAYTPSELAANPPLGAMLVRLFPFGNYLLAISDSNDDRCRLVAYLPSTQAGFTSDRLVFTPASFDGEPKVTLEGLRSSNFSQQGRFLFIGDQRGNLNVWDFGFFSSELASGGHDVVSVTNSTDEVVRQFLHRVKYVSKVLNIRQGNSSSTEWAISGSVFEDAASVTYAACGDETNLVIESEDKVAPFSKSFARVKREDGAVRTFSRVLAFNNLVVASEFTGTNILGAYELDGSLRYTQPNGLDNSLALSRISALALSEAGKPILTLPVIPPAVTEPLVPAVPQPNLGTPSGPKGPLFITPDSAPRPPTSLHSTTATKTATASKTGGVQVTKHSSVAPVSVAPVSFSNHHAAATVKGNAILLSKNSIISSTSKRNNDHSNNDRTVDASVSANTDCTDHKKSVRSKERASTMF